MDVDIITLLAQFMDEKIVYWVELMSLLRVGKYKEESKNNPLGQCVEILDSVQKVFRFNECS